MYIIWGRAVRLVTTGEQLAKRCFLNPQGAVRSGKQYPPPEQCFETRTCKTCEFDTGATICIQQLNAFALSDGMSNLDILGQTKTSTLFALPSEVTLQCAHGLESAARLAKDGRTFTDSRPWMRECAISCRS